MLLEKKKKRKRKKKKYPEKEIQSADGLLGFSRSLLHDAPRSRF